MKQLFFGDNLEVLKEIGEDSVDLVYLDPPFNSKANYNIFFDNTQKVRSEIQIQAFQDTWHWGTQSENEYDELLICNNSQVKEIIISLRNFLGESDVMAYLIIMTSRLLAMHRIIKDTGSLYLHCDATSSHYLKIILDGIFEVNNFRNEIIWKRTTAHSDSKTFGINTDRILFYTKSNQFIFNQTFLPYEESYKKRFNRHDIDGRKWTDGDLTAKGLSGGGYQYEYKGCTSLWRCPIETMKKYDSENRLHFTSKGGIRLKKYLDELPGRPFQSLWEDINPLNSQSKERLGYPTQKPLELLERIIMASSNKGDVVLDPFCGCGTAIHSAEKLGRNWIGIDITHLAISLIEKRLKDAFPKIDYQVFGIPIDHVGALELAERDKYQFQWWACSLINAIPYQGKKKGSDGGIDGLIYYKNLEGNTEKIIVSVKGGKNLNVSMIRDLGHVMKREKATIALFISLFEPTKPMNIEALKEGFYKIEGTQSKFPRIQLLTIEDLINKNKQPQYPYFNSSIVPANEGFRQAQREKEIDFQQNKLDL